MSRVITTSKKRQSQLKCDQSDGKSGFELVQQIKGTFFIPQKDDGVCRCGFCKDQKSEQVKFLAIYNELCDNYVELDINISGRSINERNFDTLLQALVMCNCRIGSLNISYNLHFKDHSLNSLIQYLEQKTNLMLQMGCRAIGQQPMVKCLRLGDQGAVSLIEAVVYGTNIRELNLAQNGLGFKTGSAVVNLLQEIKLSNKSEQLKLKSLELQFNLISESMIKRVQTLLKETQQQYQNQHNVLQKNSNECNTIEHDTNQKSSNIVTAVQTTPKSSNCKKALSNQKGVKNINTNISSVIHYPATCLNRSLAQTPIRINQSYQVQSSKKAVNQSTNRSFFNQKPQLSQKSRGSVTTQNKSFNMNQRQMFSDMDNSIEFIKFQSAQEYDFRNKEDNTERQKLLLVRKNLSKVLQSKLSRQSQMGEGSSVVLSSLKTDCSNEQQQTEESQAFEIPQYYRFGNKASKKQIVVSQDLRNQIPQITQLNTETINEILNDTSQIKNIKEYLYNEINKYQALIQQIEQHETSNKQTQQVKQLVNNLKVLKNKLYYNTCTQNNNEIAQQQLQYISMKENVYPDSTAQFSILGLKQIEENVQDLKQISDRYTQSSNRSYIQANFDQRN